MLIPVLMSLYMPYGFWMFKSRDWVDVDSGLQQRDGAMVRQHRLNPATGLMLIPALFRAALTRISADGLNPATGLMLIPAFQTAG